MSYKLTVQIGKKSESLPKYNLTPCKDSTLSINKLGNRKQIFCKLAVIKTTFWLNILREKTKLSFYSP